MDDLVLFNKMSKFEGLDPRMSCSYNQDQKKVARRYNKTFNKLDKWYQERVKTGSIPDEYLYVSARSEEWISYMRGITCVVSLDRVNTEEVNLAGETAKSSLRRNCFVRITRKEYLRLLAFQFSNDIETKGTKANRPNDNSTGYFDGFTLTNLCRTINPEFGCGIDFENYFSIDREIAVELCCCCAIIPVSSTREKIAKDKEQALSYLQHKGYTRSIHPFAPEIKAIYKFVLEEDGRCYWWYLHTFIDNDMDFVVEMYN